MNAVRDIIIIIIIMEIMETMETNNMSLYNMDTYNMSLYNMYTFNMYIVIHIHINTNITMMRFSSTGRNLVRVGQPCLLITCKQSLVGKRISACMDSFAIYISSIHGRPILLPLSLSLSFALILKTIDARAMSSSTCCSIFRSCAWNLLMDGGRIHW